MADNWMDVSPGWILPYEEAFLESLARTLKEGARAVNIGSAVGTSSSAILRGARDIEDFSLMSLDIMECPQEIETLGAQGLLKPGRFGQHVEDSVEFGKKQNIHLDLVFVDGSHEEEHVLDDLRTYSKLIKPGGLLVCHDYQDPRQPQVTSAIERWRNYKRGGGSSWLKVGQVIFTIAFTRPGGDMTWANGRL